MRARIGLRAALAGMAAMWIALGCSPSPPTAPPPGFFPPTASTTITLAPGEFVTLTGQQAVDPIEFPSAADTRAYVVAVQNASGVPGTQRSFLVRVQEVRSLSSAGMPGAPDRLAPGRAPRPERRRPALDGWYEGGEAAFRREVRDRLRGISAGAFPSRGTPVVGQSMEFRSPVQSDGTLATCTSTATVTGLVRAVGSRFAIVEDTAVAGQLTRSDFDAFLAEMEQAVAPVGDAYFGRSSDVDGNGVVIVLLSASVNRLGAAGFFTPSDLASVEDCPASNEGEVLWITGPDAGADFGEPVPVNLVRERLVGIVAHELQHLVHAQRRAFEAGGDLTSADEPWLNEGLSHIAEEVTGLYAGGLRTGANLSFADLGEAAVNARFRTYHLSVFRFLRDYLESTANVPAIVDEPVTRGALRRARGFGYLFLRWLADQYASGGAPGLVGSLREEALFQALAVGGTGLFRSTENVEQALSSVLGVTLDWRDLLARYAAVPAVDDVDPGSPIDAALRLESWNLPAAYANARDNGFDLDFPVGFPFAPRLLVLPTLPTGGFATELELLPSTVGYFRLESPRETPRARFTLLATNGALLSGDPSVQVTIVRTF